MTYRKPPAGIDNWSTLLRQHRLRVRQKPDDCPGRRRPGRPRRPGPRGPEGGSLSDEPFRATSPHVHAHVFRTFTPGSRCRRDSSARPGDQAAVRGALAAAQRNTVHYAGSSAATGDGAAILPGRRAAIAGTDPNRGGWVIPASRTSARSSCSSKEDSPRSKQSASARSTGDVSRPGATSGRSPGSRRSRRHRRRSVLLNADIRKWRSSSAGVDTTRQAHRLGERKVGLWWTARRNHPARRRREWSPSPLLRRPWTL